MASRSVRHTAFAVTAAFLVCAAPLRADEPTVIARQFYERFAAGDVDGVKQLLAGGVILPRLTLFANTWRTRCVSIRR